MANDMKITEDGFVWKTISAKTAEIRSKSKS